jgi:hypothetical protein
LHTVPKQELVPISIDHPQNSANQVLSSRMRQHSAEDGSACGPKGLGNLAKASAWVGFTPTAAL